MDGGEAPVLGDRDFSIPGRNQQRPSVVRFENVGLRYGMGAEILRDISFSIEPQTFQFLTGPFGRRKDDLVAPHSFIFEADARIDQSVRP